MTCFQPGLVALQQANVIADQQTCDIADGAANDYISLWLLHTCILSHLHAFTLACFHTYMLSHLHAFTLAFTLARFHIRYAAFGNW